VHVEHVETYLQLSRRKPDVLTHLAVAGGMRSIISGRSTFHPTLSEVAMLSQPFGTPGALRVVRLEDVVDLPAGERPNRSCSRPEPADPAPLYPPMPRRAEKRGTGIMMHRSLCVPAHARVRYRIQNTADLNLYTRVCSSDECDDHVSLLCCAAQHAGPACKVLPCIQCKTQDAKND
jgi:hypothetical protein